MGELLEQFAMEANFEGLIQLLAKNLYPEPDVFIRELVQNAHDGIVRRQEVEPEIGGRIDIAVEHDGSTIWLIFRDNGLGMDVTDIKHFLSVIGSSGTGSTKSALEQSGRPAAYQLIGQFGIGMLSAFVVAAKVVVKTRKIGEEHAYAWHNSGATECELYIDEKESIGTEIAVQVRTDFNFLTVFERIRKVIIKYCDFIPFPIYLEGQGPINAIDAPWHRSHWSSQTEKEATYKQFLNRRYPDVPLDVIPIEIEAPYQAQGALYISDRHVPDINTTGVVDIFVRRMFIRENDNAFLPSWAKFVRGVIDSRDLKPTAARDNIQRENNPAFEFLQKRLGELIVERLSYLAKAEPNKFRQINHWHHYHLKGMAYYYDDFFDDVAGLLLVETNKGFLSLADYLTKNAPRPGTGNKAPIYYFAYHGAATQFYRLADARGWVVINAGQRFEEEILEKYAERNAGRVHLERLDATDDPELFGRLAPAEEEEFRGFELDMEGHLRRLGLPNILVRMRHFAPADLPAIIILTPESAAEQQLKRVVTQPWFMEAMEDVAKEALEQSRKRPLYLSLNADNKLIQQLASLDRTDPLVREIMTGIYNSAVLYSHNLLTTDNAEIIHGQFIRLFETLIEHARQVRAVQHALEETRRQLIDVNMHATETIQQLGSHVLLFMITPFDSKFKKLEDAVRRIFERSPYFFEVRLARDYTHSTALLQNVREHISRAHGFIAEISDLNPNVMFELGAAVATTDTRPVFSLRSAIATKEVPADLKEALFIQYGSLDDEPEKIEMDIRGVLERDGRVVHDGVRRLLEVRKHRFLSRTLLENLRTRLDAKSIAGLMQSYATVEDLLSASVHGIREASQLPEYLISAIRGELAELADLDKSHK